MSNPEDGAIPQMETGSYLSRNEFKLMLFMISGTKLAEELNQMVLRYDYEDNLTRETLGNIISCTQMQIDRVNVAYQRELFQTYQDFLNTLLMYFPKGSNESAR